MSKLGFYIKRGQVVNLDYVKFFYKFNGRLAGSAYKTWRIDFELIENDQFNFIFETKEERDEGFDELINQLEEKNNEKKS